MIGVGLFHGFVVPSGCRRQCPARPCRRALPVVTALRPARWGGKRASLQKQPPSADTNTVMNTSNAQTLPMRTLYAPNPPQLDDPWMRALLVLLVVFGLAALFTLGS